MDRSLLFGVGIGVVVAAAAGAIASYSGKGDKHTVEQPLAITSSVTKERASQAKLSEAAAPVAAPEPATASVANKVGTGKSHPVKERSSRAPMESTVTASSYGIVVSSNEVVDTQKVPRQDCHDEQVTQKKAVKDEKRIAGAALGAVIGGVLGNQVGDGNGRKLATVAGAVAGGVAGSKIQKRVQDGNTETVTEKRCVTVYDIKEKSLGYDVKYRVGNEIKHIRMSSSPDVGSKLPLRGNQAVAVAARN